MKIRNVADLCIFNELQLQLFQPTSKIGLKLEIVAVAKIEQAQDRAEVTDGWAGEILPLYRSTVQNYFTLTYLTMTYQ